MTIKKPQYPPPGDNPGFSSSLTRRGFLHSAAALSVSPIALATAGYANTIGTDPMVVAAAPTSSSAGLQTPEGPGSASGAPYLPKGFGDTFTSRYVNTGELRLHAVIGGKGPPLLLVHGWPQTWYQWRLVMPALARDFQVIAVDQRGIGLSDKPQTGYDAGSEANDMVALMDALGHQRFAMIGFDTGMPIAYALAADHPERLDRMVVGEAVITGVTPSPPLFVPGPLNKRLWHIAFNRLDAEVNEALVRGREHIYFGAEYAARLERRCPTTSSGITSSAWPPAPMRCAAVSGHTARSTPASRRTNSARPGD